MSQPKVKGQGHQRQKRAVHSHHPRQRRNGTRWLQITSRSSRPIIPLLPVVISSGCVRSMFGKTSLALIFSFFCRATHMQRICIARDIHVCYAVTHYLSVCRTPVGYCIETTEQMELVLSTEVTFGLYYIGFGYFQNDVIPSGT